jgi:hypothetical protein
MRHGIRKGLIGFVIVVIISLAIYQFKEQFAAYNYWPPKAMPTSRLGSPVPDSTPVSEQVNTAKYIGYDARKDAPANPPTSISGRIEEFNNYTIPQKMASNDRHFQWLQTQPQTDYYNQAKAYIRAGIDMTIDPMPAVCGRMTTIEKTEEIKGNALALSDFSSMPAPTQVGMVRIPNVKTTVSANEE